jgi:hypothetical protein
MPSLRRIDERGVRGQGQELSPPSHTGQLS